MIVLLVIILAQPAGAAFLCVQSEGDSILLADNDAITRPDGDWYAHMRVKMTSNAGTDRGLFWGFSDTVSTVLVFALFEASNGTVPRRDNVRSTIGDGADSVEFLGTSATFASNTNWVNVAQGRSGTTFSQYLNNVLDGSQTNANVNAINTTTNRICSADCGCGEFLDGSVAEFAMWSRDLSAGERVALEHGFAPNCMPNSLDVYVPMIGDAYQERRHGITVTNSGTAPVAHPRIIYCGE